MVVVTAPRIYLKCPAGVRRDAAALSELPEKKHPWAKYQARPVAPRPLQERSAPGGLRPRSLPAIKTAPVAAPPGGPVRVVVPPVTHVSAPVAPKARETKSVTPASGPAVAPKPPVRAKAVVPPVAPRPPSPTVVHVAPPPAVEPSKAEPPIQVPITAELAASLEQLDGFETAPGWPTALKKSVRPAGQGRLSWVWRGFKDSVRNYRANFRRLAAWWRDWRSTASCRVLIAFIAIYGVLAFMRAPSDSVVERSRRAEEIGFLQNFLKTYATAGGLLLAEKPHGGFELYPRGVVMKGEMLAAFVRAPLGEVFTVKFNSAEANPLAGFYGFPPIFAGGDYFHLERQFNFALYRCTFLVRKDSEKTGTLLLSRIEPGN